MSSRSRTFTFSFSGLKTAVARWVERHPGPLPIAAVGDLLANAGAAPSPLTLGIEPSAVLRAALVHA
jgi:hypothetical protein